MKECLYKPPRGWRLLDELQMAIWGFFLYIFENAMLNVYFSAEMLLQLVCELLCDFFVYNVYKSV